MSTQVQTATQRKVFVDLDGYDRIRAHSPEHLNRKVEQEIEQSVKDASSDQQALSQRIAELDREWDIDRAAMLTFAALASLVWVLGLTKNRKWLALHAIQLPFLAYHAATGWFPPVSVLRRLGFRSSKEIDAEKYALKTLRGDFAK